MIDAWEKVTIILLCTVSHQHSHNQMVLHTGMVLHFLQTTFWCKLCCHWFRCSGFCMRRLLTGLEPAIVPAIVWNILLHFLWQEVGKLKGELQKQTTALLSRIDDRDEEIHRLRNQVNHCQGWQLCASVSMYIFYRFQFRNHSVRYVAIWWGVHLVRYGVLIIPNFPS